ncbi:cytosine permease [Rhodanobacter sp. PCA2]|uniref:cytosine permease n=1 Tax=Rhodanobacter sp. PCA2 TaxID=2006117 RepID=UPI0015E76507|nr:cytosine permease [Rhodanobacter sp. PCA2]
MSKSASAAPEQDFARDIVPDEATGPARQVFYIVAGSCSGLTVFILASEVAHGLGLLRALWAFIAGSLISGVLGAISVYVGSRTRLSFALLVRHTFGAWGAQAVRLVVALSLIGWFAVIVSQLGAAASELVRHMLGWDVAAPCISIPLSFLITLVVLKGVSGLERLGQVVVVLTVVLLLVGVAMTWHALGPAGLDHGSGSLTFGEAVSAVVGSYIVGIVIQPDYGRFVRSPSRAALAVLWALGLVYPISLFLSAVPAAALNQPDFSVALISMGIGLPALLLLFLGAWMGAAACLYSGSLSLANLLPRLKMNWVVVGAGSLGALLALLHIDRHFMPFLQLLSVTLPPVATVQCFDVLWAGRHGSVWNRSSLETGVSITAWIVGSAIGLGGEHHVFEATGIATLDAILGTLMAMGIGRLLVRRGSND